MQKSFTYLDNLGHLLKSSPEPFANHVLQSHAEEGFENYDKSASIQYDIYAETSPDIISKYTMISRIPDSSKKSQPTRDETDIDSPTSPSPDKMEKPPKMSIINTVYIGSLTIVGLYVLFKYLTPFHISNADFLRHKK